MGKAKLFRTKIGNSGLDQTASKITKVLAAGGIPCTIVGGFALQEHGYHRGTLDVDLIVPDLRAASDYLSTLGFQASDSPAILYDRENGVEVNLLAAGAPATNASPLPIPDVDHPATASPTVLPLRDLIEMKLNVYVGNPDRYIKHKSDVMELIARNHLPESFYHSSISSLQAAWVHSWQAM